jgi:hypothetical protein
MVQTPLSLQGKPRIEVVNAKALTSSQPQALHGVQTL